jgi:hypothetical protein
MKSRHWHSIIIAEQVLNSKPMRNISYIDYKQLKENNTSNTYDAADTRDSGISEYISNQDNNLDLEASKNYLYVDEQLEFKDYGKIMVRDEFEVPNESTDIPEWLKNDMKDCEYIPIDALNKSFSKSQNQNILNESSKSNIKARLALIFIFLKERHIFKFYLKKKDLEQANQVINQLRQENLKLKEENKMVRI